MSQYYPRREREREPNAVDSATEYAKHYQRTSQRAARAGDSAYSPPASAAYDYTRQRTRPSNGSGGGSYEDRAIPIRERDRDYDRDYDRRAYRDYRDDDDDDDDDDEEDEEDDDVAWQQSSSPRTPRTAGMTSGSSIGGGSYGRRERDMAESPRYSHDVRTSPPNRHRDVDRERDRPRDRERDRREREDRVRDQERNREEAERKRDRNDSRKRMRNATQSYPRRLREYLMPVLQNQAALDHATDLFIKLDQDARYMTQSASVLLESLATVADSQQQAKAASASKRKNANGSGGEDSEDFTTSTEESSVLETTAEEVSDDSDLDDSHSDSGDDDDDDDENQFGVFSADGNDMPNFGGPGGSRRPSVINTADGMGGPGMGGARRRSSAGHRSSFAEHSRKGSSGSVSGNPTALMKWGGFRPYALSKHTANVNDKRKSFLALTQIISVTLLASLGIDPDAPATNSRKGSKKNTRLSTKGLLAELLRVLKPKDYRAYFRASARVIMVPTVGGGAGGAGSIGGGGAGMFGSSLGMGGGGSLGKSIGRSGVPDELVLEALERQLLGMAKFQQAVATSSSMASATPAGPMMACLTYSSGKYGSITLYRLDMASPGSSAAMAGYDGWPRRITPVSAMTGVPKELLRSTVESMQPSRRTILQIDSETRDREGKAGRHHHHQQKNKMRPRWPSMPSDTPLPCLGYSPSVDHTKLTQGLCDALLIQPEDLEIQPGVMANIVNATLPAMVCWLHARTAYLSNIEFEAPEVQRAPSNSTRRDRERERERDFDDNASTSTISSRGRVRRIVRWRRGPDVVEHEGREPTVVVLHPARGDWVTTPVYWTDSKEVVADEAVRESRERERERYSSSASSSASSSSTTSSRDSRDKDRESKRERREAKEDNDK